MIDVSGAQLITQASMFGGAAVLFTLVPFLYAIISGIMQSREATSGGQTIVSIVVKALIVHIIACVAFMASIYALDKTNPNTSNYFSNKVFEVFWNGDNQSKVLGLVGGSNSSETSGAYAILHLLSVITNFAYAISPIAVFILSIAYGVNLAKKDTYRDSYVDIATWSVISIVCCGFLYTAWVRIASPALFLPESDLFTRISNFYKEILFN